MNQNQRMAAGRKGGKKVLRKYGRKFFAKIGKKGGATTRRLTSCGRKKGCR